MVLFFKNPLLSSAIHLTPLRTQEQLLFSSPERHNITSVLVSKSYFIYRVNQELLRTHHWPLQFRNPPHVCLSQCWGLQRRSNIWLCIFCKMKECPWNISGTNIAKYILYFFIDWRLFHQHSLNKEEFLS